MIIHPVILIPKLVIITIIIVVLVVLHASLTPEQFAVAVLISIIGFGVFVVIFWTVLLKFMKNPKSRLSKMIVLSDTQKPEDGFLAASNSNQRLIGARGKAFSALRPSGIAMIKGERVGVQTRGDFLSAGSEVEVIAVEGSRVIVQQVQDGNG